MSTGHILVVAPDPDFRRSLEFALEAEGYDVASRPGLQDAFGPVPYACVVVDHQAATGPAADVAAFCRRAQPLIVLAGRDSPWLSRHAFRTVRKPLLGNDLIEAVHAAVGAGGPPPASS
jgi:DNA-binding response OmpR family regulator